MKTKLNPRAHYGPTGFGPWIRHRDNLPVDMFHSSQIRIDNLTHITLQDLRFIFVSYLDGPILRYKTQNTSDVTREISILGLKVNKGLEIIAVSEPI